MAHFDLRDQVKSLVRDAIAANRQISKADIVRQFKDRGASRATLHRWIDEAVSDAGVRHLIKRDSPPDQALIHERAASLIATAAPAPAPGIPVLDRLQGCLDVFDAMLRISKDENGIIRNVRLAGFSAGEIRKTIQTLATVQIAVRDNEAERQFLASLADVIHEEEPAIRDRIVAKMRALGHGGML